jgi:alpha-tubulin suppressor-like RCC1 family protein
MRRPLLAVLGSIALAACPSSSPRVPRAASAPSPGAAAADASPETARATASDASATCAADLRSAPTDCGGCGHACAPEQLCVAGACRVDQVYTAYSHHRPGGGLRGYTVHRRLTVTPLALDLSGAAAEITLGGDMACVLRAAGGAACWGVERDGQLGDGAAEGLRSTPVTLRGVPDVVAVSAGSRFACARTRGGAAWCWGENYAGEVGQPGSTHPVLQPRPVPGITDATALDAGLSTACVVRATGAVWCWGQRRGPERNADQAYLSTAPEAIAGVSDAVAVSLGSLHACALRRSGRVACWGENNVGALGDGTETARSAAVDVPGLAPARAVSAGDLHTCAALRDGTVWCWGGNYWGQLGATAHARTMDPRAVRNVETPRQVPGLTDAQTVVVGAEHSCALRGDGTVWCWGADYLGHLGDGSVERVREAPAPVRWLDDVVALDVAPGQGRAATCAVRRDGGVRCWGQGDALWDVADAVTADAGAPR